MTDYTGTIVVPGRFHEGRHFKATGYYTFGATVVTGDTIAWAILPEFDYNKIQITSFKMWGAETDTDASPTGTEIVGDGTDTDNYVTSKVGGGAGQQFFICGDGELITGTDATPASRTITLTVGGTLATANTGSGSRFIEVEYYCKGKV